MLKDSRLFVWMVTVFAAVCALMFGYNLFRQHVRLSQFQQGEGTIVESRVLKRRLMLPSTASDENFSYHPVLKYEYFVDGERFVGTELDAVDSQPNSAKEVYPLIERFPEGAKVPVYYDPRQPGRSFLINAVHISPYVVFLVSWAGVLLGWYVLSEVLGSFHRKPKVRSLNEGRAILADCDGIGRTMRMTVVYGLLYYVPYMLAVASYAAVGRGLHPIYLTVLFAVYGVLGIPLLVCATWLLLQYLGVSDVRLEIEGVDHFRPDSEIRVHIRQSVRKRLRIVESGAGVVLARYERDHEDAWPAVTVVDEATITGPLDVLPGQEITYEGAFRIPASAPESGWSRDEEFPYYEWVIRVRTDFESKLYSYSVDFPISVKRSESVAGSDGARSRNVARN